MHILLTGGTGLIGRQLAYRLMVDHDITVLTRDAARARAMLSPSIDLIEDLSTWQPATRVDAVINLAGEPIADKRWTTAQKQRICASRWNKTQQLVDWIRAQPIPPHTLLSGSAIGYYGRQPQDVVVTEEQHRVTPEFTHEVCAKWEGIAMSVSSASTRVCVLRTGVVLSTQGGALVKMALPFKLGVGGQVGSGEQMLSWIHIEDMVEAMVFLLEHAHCKGIYNLTAPTPVSNADFSQTLASVLHRPNLFRVPIMALKLLMGEASDLVTTGQSVLPKRLQEAGYRFRYPQLEGALRDLYQ